MCTAIGSLCGDLVLVSGHQSNFVIRNWGVCGPSYACVYNSHSNIDPPKKCSSTIT